MEILGVVIGVIALGVVIYVIRDSNKKDNIRTNGSGSRGSNSNQKEK